MKCPACNEELKLAERTGIEIDYCAKCRGVWLDRGELDKLIERSFQQELPHPTQHPHAPRPDIHGSGHTPTYCHGFSSKHKPPRKKSFLEDLFD